MCGIAGLINPKQIAPSQLPALAVHDLEDLSRGMLGLMKRRGPDEMGLLMHPHGFLGNARLSIIDLEHGSQPICNENEDVWVVYNGEIYDVDQHISRLTAKGHVFKTRSDTEILVHLYEDHGEELVSHLNGEFAFCLFDVSRQEILLARDSFGTKPLYYCEIGQDAWLFASEVKPLFWAMGRTKPPLSSVGISQILEGWTTVPPDTCFEGISQLPPGTIGRIGPRGYFSIKPYRRQAGNQPGEVNNNIYPLMWRAVSRRLKADVPVGVYLSGGLDSGIVAALAGRISDHPLHSFSIEFEDQQFDESSHQKTLHEFLGTRHHSLRVTDRDIRDNFREAVLAAESVVFRSAFVPMFLLSGLVKNSGVKVVLTGEGADELFGGYDIYRELKVLQFWARNPESTIRPLLLMRLYHYLPHFQAGNLRFLIPYYKAFLEKMNARYCGHAIRWSNYSTASHILNDPPPAPMAPALDKLIMDPDRLSADEQCRQVEIKTLLHGYLLSSQGDRMAYRHSVETRLPFLDNDVADFAQDRPVTQFIPVLKEKDILYRSFSSVLPSFIMEKPKMPYLAPDCDVFLKDNGKGEWRDYLSDASIKETGIFNDTNVNVFLKRVRSQFARSGKVPGRDSAIFFTLLSSSVIRRDLCRNLKAEAIDHLLSKKINLS